MTTRRRLLGGVGAAAIALTARGADAQSLLLRGVGGSDGGDPFWSSVTLLCDFDGTNGSTTFVDLSSFAHALAATGTGGVSPTLSTAQQQFGPSSMVNTHNNDWVQGPVSTDFAFGAGQFTIEFWVRWTNFAAFTGNTGLLSVWTDASIGWAFVVNSGLPGVTFVIGPLATAVNIQGPFAVANNVWYALAVDRDGSNVIRIYLNGAMIGSAVNASAFVAAQAVQIGNWTAAAADRSLIGFIDEMRITKGVARYASNGGYTVAVAPFPIG